MLARRAWPRPLGMFGMKAGNAVPARMPMARMLAQRSTAVKSSGKLISLGTVFASNTGGAPRVLMAKQVLGELSRAPGNHSRRAFYRRRRDFVEPAGKYYIMKPQIDRQIRDIV